MHLAGPPSRDFERAAIVAPDHFGAVAWTDFNRAYARFQSTPWRLVNRARRYGWLRRIARLAIAYLIQKNDAFLDLASKARALSRLPIPRDPDIIYYGAEVGWEAYLLRALYGAGGRLVLIDADPGAYARFLGAERDMCVSSPQGALAVKREVERTEYARQDFFAFESEQKFDVGLEWGLLEHFEDAHKQRVLEVFRRHLKPTGVQVSAVPRDALNMRLFYWAFADELNFGYRELLSPAELERVLARAGFEVIASALTPTTCIAVSRVTRGDT